MKDATGQALAYVYARETRAVPRLRFANAQWVKPHLKARVHHLAGSQNLRHGTLRGFS